MVNPVEEILTNIPKLREIKDTSSNIEFVSCKNWNSRLKSISTKNLKKYKRAVTNLEPYFSPCIICVCSDDTVEINKEKYSFIRKYVMSDEHHK